MVLGITGGMGCGKSTAAKMFERLAFRRLDLDAVVRERVLTQGAVVGALGAHFGSGVLDASGAVNRAAVAERVFDDDAELRWLEELIHPKVFAIWSAYAAEAREQGENAVIEVPLLFERSLENKFDFTVCVACTPEKQLERLEQRGLKRAFAEKRIFKQLPLARKIELSDFVLWNEGSQEFLESQVNRLAASLPGHPGNPPSSPSKPLHGQFPKER
jgi:dephospho-CoA kinase